MIRYLRGTIIEINPQNTIIDVSGVGYGIFVSEHISAGLVCGEDVEMHIYTHVREQEISLYGFHEVQDRAIFELLISVSGIGPKAALNILSIADAGAIAAAVHNKDLSILTKVSGIGKRMAEKIVIELFGKLDNFALKDAQQANDDSNVIDALKSMGYTVGESREALSHVDKEITEVSERIKSALKNLG